MKTKLLIACLIVWGTTQAQYSSEALRYSEDVPEGNARFAGMAGSMSALGGNLSAISYNPAGLAVLQTGVFELGLGGLYNSTTAKYQNESNNGLKTGITFSNLGIAGCKNDMINDLGVKNINYAFTVNRLNDFNSKSVISGNTNTTSMVDDFGVRLATEKRNDYYQELAYNTFIMDIDSNGNYYSRVNPFDWKRQTQVLTTSGRKLEYGFSLGANFSDIVYLGGSLNIQSFTYNETKVYSETDKTIPDIKPFQSFTLKRTLSSSGSGFNLKLGTIVRPVKDLRLGLAIHTPTVLSVDETYNSSMTAYYDYPIDGYYDHTSSPSSPGQFNYTIISPFKAEASLGVTLHKSFALNFDYEFVDYSSMRLEMTSDNSNTELNQNEEISNKYRATQNLRAGAELWLGKVGLRAGAALYGNPYANAQDNEFFNYRTRYTGGISIRAKNSYFDLAYVRTINKGDEFLYTSYEGNPVTASTIQNSNRIIATIGFKF